VGGRFAARPRDLHVFAHDDERSAGRTRLAPLARQTIR
jgi:hypothetical protein